MAKAPCEKTMSDSMLEIISKALGRSEPPAVAPVPPEIPDAIARLVARDKNLSDVFAKSATDAKFKLARVTRDELTSRVVQFLQDHKTKKVGIPASEFLGNLGIQKAIEDCGISVVRWDESTLDAAYDLYCCITDVYAAVAETGSLVIRPSAGHGRVLSLVPPVHVAIVEPGNIVADLIDLLEKIAAAPRAPNITLITGPSKTADIEGALVTGVHGPGVVGVFLVE
jgi:L-lactate dehydrogenase complex protein LldG